MKIHLTPLALILAAGVCLAADDTARPVEDDFDPALDSPAPVPTAAPAAAPVIAGASLKVKDGVEVVSKTSTSLTVKLDGKETNVPVSGKAAVALRVVNPGDKVRLFYVDADAEGRPAAASGFTITEPKKDSDKNAGKADVKR